MFARTERLMLRPAWHEDAEAIAELVNSERKMRDLFANASGCDLRQPCALDACRHDADLPKLLVFRRTDGAPELIGTVGLEKSAPGEARLLCWIARPHRRMGYGAEAVRALVCIARDGLRLRRLVAPSSLEGAARGLLENAGFSDGGLTFGEDCLEDACPAEPFQAQAA